MKNMKKSSKNSVWYDINYVIFYSFLVIFVDDSRGESVKNLEGWSCNDEERPSVEKRAEGCQNDVN